MLAKQWMPPPSRLQLQLFVTDAATLMFLAKSSNRLPKTATCLIRFSKSAAGHAEAAVILYVWRGQPSEVMPQLGRVQLLILLIHNRIAHKFWSLRFCLIPEQQMSEASMLAHASLGLMANLFTGLHLATILQGMHVTTTFARATLHPIKGCRCVLDD